MHRGEEGLPKGGQGGVPAGLFKQRHPQLALQLPDGVAEAGLGDAQLLGRPGVVLHLGQVEGLGIGTVAAALTMGKVIGWMGQGVARHLRFRPRAVPHRRLRQA